MENNKIHIYFDWSGTLAPPNTRHLINKQNVLYDDVKKCFKYLNKKGYILGIISNTKMRSEEFINGLKFQGIFKYLNGKILLSSEICKKPCKNIFDLAHNNTLNMYYVGNNHEKDIIGANDNGYISVNIIRENNEPSIHAHIIIRTICDLIKFL